MRALGYNPDFVDRWDMLVMESPTGTFLHRRGYMDYHSDRFIDCSVMVFDDKDRLVAALPANADGHTVVSHGGLTYGGWLVDSRRVGASAMLAVWDSALDYYRSLGFEEMVYKSVPDIYHRYPAEDDIYALFRHGAAIDCVQVSAAIDLDAPMGFDSNASRGAAYAAKSAVTIRESDDFRSFWEILSKLLVERYGTSPVHSLAEIELLRSRFPDNIRFYGAYHGTELVAGTVMYLTDTVAHAQYIAASPKGKELKALPLLFKSLIEGCTGRFRYFDFGTSNERHGQYLNEGLIRQKTGMGGRGIAYTTYKLNL